jgi:hypothetical protein
MRARVIAEAIGQQLKRRVIVENRLSAGGTIGALAVARSNPDRSTLLFTNNSHVVSPLERPAIKNPDGINHRGFFSGVSADQAKRKSMRRAKLPHAGFISALAAARFAPGLGPVAFGGT